MSPEAVGGEEVNKQLFLTWSISWWLAAIVKYIAQWNYPQRELTACIISQIVVYLLGLLWIKLSVMDTALICFTIVPSLLALALAVHFHNRGDIFSQRVTEVESLILTIIFMVLIPLVRLFEKP